MSCCKPCANAERYDPRRVEFGAECVSCLGRALAAIGADLESRDLGGMTDHYRKVLGQVFGDSWEEGAALVKHWSGCIDRHQARQLAQKVPL